MRGPAPSFLKDFKVDGTALTFSGEIRTRWCSDDYLNVLRKVSAEVQSDRLYKLA